MFVKYSHTLCGRLFCFLWILLCGAAKGQIVADFRADVTQGCAPLVVLFTDLSGLRPADPTSKWDWYFGNGTHSTQKNPGTIYFTPGKYSVKLVIENSTGKDSIIKENFIVVNSTPVVDFAANSTLGCVPFTVKFTDKSTSLSGTNNKWQWDFGDGSTSMQQSPSHTYNVSGDFTITLKVNNSLGCADVHTSTSFIHVIDRPKANFTSGSASATCNPPILVNFLNTSAGGIIAAKWDFGDGTTALATNPSHVYTRAGTFPVTLIVTNLNGCVDTITKPTVIGSVRPAFTAPDIVCQGADASFVNASSPATASAYWDFGDNTSSTDINPVKKFAVAGSFAVKLVNNFGACKDSISRSITVLPKPGANFSFTAPGARCKLPLDVSFTANTAGATSYFWNFGDGNTSSLTNPSHTYTTFGRFAPKLKVTSANGCADSTMDSIFIVPAKIHGFNNLPLQGCVPYQSLFSADITSPEPVVSYLWNFGDGTTSADPTPVHDYNKEGSYNVSLKITTANGCTDTFVLPAAIVITLKPKANFTASPLIACANEKVKFTDASAGNITSWKWQFGDGGVSDSANPLYRYSDTGFFTVKLIVGSLSCFDTITVQNYVYINPPIAIFAVGYNCDSPYIRHFKNRSVSAKTNKWTFGDGTESTDISPAHVYASPGVYMVSLHVTNGGCSDDFVDTIKVIDEHPDFTSNLTALCKNNTAVFTAINVNTQNIATYAWDFRDSTPIFSGTGTTSTHNYLKAGIYSPQLIVTDVLGCTRTAEHPVSITIYGPLANFTNPDGACLNTQVTFTDQSQPTANHPITSWIFNYGDGKEDTSAVRKIFSYTYTTPKTYNLSLIVTDSYGCKDTLYKPNGINITNPKASFTLNDSISCNNSSVTFINQSAGLDLTYFWNFGDASSATAANPSHTFLSEGNYNIALAVRDRYGCVDTIRKTNGVVVGNALASFALSDSVISCPPAQINFVNKSNYFTSVKWDFDDGNFSNIQNPLHYFLSARPYHIKLTAFGHGGCVDSIVRDILVKGPTGSFTYNPVIKCVPATIQFTAKASNNNNNFTWDFGDGTTTITAVADISHAYNVPGKFLPKVILTDTMLHCQVPIFGSDSITVTGALSFIKSHQSLFCDSASIQFFDSLIVKFDTAASYSWSFGDGAVSNSSNPFHNYAGAGLYPVRLIVKTTGGCTDSTATTFIKVVTSPKVQITGPGVTCVNQTVNFSGTLQPDTSTVRWNWDFNNGSKSAVASPPSQTYTVAGSKTITAMVANSSGCVTTSTKTLTVNPLPNVDAGIDSVICLGASLTLIPSGADTYVWRNSSSLSCTACTNPVASPVDTSLYYMVTGTNALTTCEKTDSVKIKVIQPFKLVGMTADTLCKGQSVQLSVTGTDNYSWSPATGLSNANIANPVARPDTTTLYTVTGHDYRNCFKDAASFPVTVYPIPVFDITDNNITITAGNSVSLKTTSSRDVVSWQWFPAAGLSCSNCPEPVATPAATTVYKATAVNGGGCRAEDRVTVQVFCNNGNLYMPNTFSPNNDGSNDVFFPRGKGIASVRSLLIFNRWGAVVFKKLGFSVNDSNAGWNGTYDGKPVDADVFVYQIEVTCETGQVFSFKGDITVIR